MSIYWFENIYLFRFFLMLFDIVDVSKSDLVASCAWRALHSVMRRQFIVFLIVPEAFIRLWRFWGATSQRWWCCDFRFNWYLPAHVFSNPCFTSDSFFDLFLKTLVTNALKTHDLIRSLASFWVKARTWRACTSHCRVAFWLLQCKIPRQRCAT